MENFKVTSMVKCATLLLLSQRKRYGYELLKELERLFGKEMSAAHVYPFLGELKRKGFVLQGKAGTRAKKHYALTLAGKHFTKQVLERMHDIMEAFVKAQVKKCAHCSCEIYKNGFERTMRGKKFVFCCKFCAEDFS